jgi:hypothetical protein
MTDSCKDMTANNSTKQMLVPLQTIGNYTWQPNENGDYLFICTVRALLTHAAVIACACRCACLGHCRAVAPAQCKPHTVCTLLAANHSLWAGAYLLQASSLYCASIPCCVTCT